MVCTTPISDYWSSGTCAREGREPQRWVGTSCVNNRGKLENDSGCHDFVSVSSGCEWAADTAIGGLRNYTRAEMCNLQRQQYRVFHCKRFCIGMSLQSRRASATDTAGGRLYNYAKRRICHLLYLQKYECFLRRFGKPTYY